MVAEVFTEDIPVVQTEVTRFFLPNLGTHEVFFFFFFLVKLHLMFLWNLA